MASEKTSLRAKPYRNRKREPRIQVAGLQADFVKLVKGDPAITEDLKSKVAEAVKNMPPE